MELVVVHLFINDTIKINQRNQSTIHPHEHYIATIRTIDVPALLAFRQSPNAPNFVAHADK